MAKLIFAAGLFAVGFAVIHGGAYAILAAFATWLLTAIACHQHRREKRERELAALHRRTEPQSSRIPSDLFLKLCGQIEDWKRFRVVVFKSGGCARFPGPPMEYKETLEAAPRPRNLCNRYGPGVYCLLLSEAPSEGSSVALATYLEV